MKARSRSDRCSRTPDHKEKVHQYYHFHGHNANHEQEQEDDHLFEALQARQLAFSSHHYSPAWVVRIM